MEKRKRREAAITQEVQRRLRQEAEAGATEWLPMPYRGRRAETRKLPFEEWKEYRLRQDLHHEQFLDYEKGWERPSAQTAAAVWDLLDLRIEKLVTLYPRFHNLEPADRQALAVTIKQALLVVLDRFVISGHRRQMVTENYAFDALAACWSDHYRRAQKDGRVFVRDMKEETAVNSRRDLLRNGIRFQALWAAATKTNPFYRVERIPQAGYRVHLNYGALKFQQFEALVRQDPDYRRPDVSLWRLLPAGEPCPRRAPERDICAERAYNEVQIGSRSERLLSAQEHARVFFHPTAFIADYHATQAEAAKIDQQLKTQYNVDPDLSTYRPSGRKDGHEVPSERERRLWVASKQVPQDQRKVWVETARGLLEQYDKAQEVLSSFRSVHEQLDARGGSKYFPIKSGFYRIINRRYQHAHFWPSEISARLDRRPGEDVEFSLRERWFSMPLDQDLARELQDSYWDVSWLDLSGGFPVRQPFDEYDVSSSQTQILAVFLGLDDFERTACSLDPPFKKYLAAHAWQQHCKGEIVLDDGYTGSNDPCLVRLVKDLWMRVLYGSTPAQVVRDQRAEPLTYGPGWTAENASCFLESVLRDQKAQEVEDFLMACRQLVKVACKADPCRGVVFTDPFDGAEVRWNPVQRTDIDLQSERQRITVSLPGRSVRGKFRPATPDPNGDYPVDRRKLRNMVAPCLVHMLDAYFSSLVMERLVARGVRDFIAIHDCWLVPHFVRTTSDPPEEGWWVIEQAIRDAGEDWLKGLGPVYDRLIEYLGEDPTYGDFVRRIKTTWEARAREGRRPHFRAARPPRRVWLHEADPPVISSA